MYGSVGYRKRYGAQAVTANQFGYAGYDGCGCEEPVGALAGPVAYGGGYGTPILMGSGANAGYGAPGVRNRRKRPFWNTVGDTAAIGIGVTLGALFLGPLVIPAAAGAAGILGGGAVAGGALAAVGVARRKAAMRRGARRGAAIGRVKRRRWKLRAQNRRARLDDLRNQLRARILGRRQQVGQGAIGTAAAEGYYDVTADQGEPGVDTAVGGGFSPFVAVGAVILLGGAAWFATRRDRRGLGS